MQIDLTGKTALVTGSTEGIGYSPLPNHERRVCMTEIFPDFDETTNALVIR